MIHSRPISLRIFICLCLLISLACNLLQPGVSSCEEGPGNRLRQEASPYLLKHAANPVDWYPWGEEAFARAREEDKPVFLSIGYLTCHWCNVMEEESFSDPQVAALINEVFIPVKVDREERPDIDQVYMKACYLLSPSCGWPLTLFLTPDGKPFYAAAYIPKSARFNRPGLLELIPRVKELWAKERDSVLRSADSINSAIVTSTDQLPGGEPDRLQLDTAFQAFSRDFDPIYGGFGKGSKFPKPLNLLFLLRYWHRTSDKTGLAMVEKTLTAMRQGGIYDQLGHGFHRYATDSMWRLPHFEKMLYDQALTALAYLETYQATAKDEYALTAKEILDFVLQNMASGKGGFYSGISADSEGEEGRYYLWSAPEVGKVLGPREAAEAGRIFHITAEGNYVDPLSREKTGRNILFVNQNWRQNVDFEKIRSRLLAARQMRPSPEIDNKVLTDWNGLMIAALARAAWILEAPAYGEAAEQAARFILGNLRTSDGKLLHRWRGGRAGLAATSADYSFLIWGLLELYAWDFNPQWLQQSLALTDDLLQDYWDVSDGGFYLTPADPKGRLPRIKEIIDTALPSTNSVAMQILLKLSRLTGNQSLEERAVKISTLFSSRVKESPLSCPMFLTALDLALNPSREVVIVGRWDAVDTGKMLQVLRRRYLPEAVLLFKPAEEKDPAISRYADFVEFMQPINSKATAYVCTDFKCNFPTTDPEKMLELLTAVPEKKQGE